MLHQWQGAPGTVSQTELLPEQIPELLMWSCSGWLLLTIHWPEIAVMGRCI